MTVLAAKPRVPRATGTRSPDPRKRRPRFRLSRIGDYAYLAPALILVGVLLLGSAIYTVVISFTEWNLIGSPTFVGVEQYAKVFADPVIRTSLLNTVIWVVGSLVLPVLGGLLLAVFLDSVPLRELWKALIYLPVVLAPTVTGAIWKQIFTLDGPLNSMLAGLGMGGETSWLTESPLNTYVMVVTSTWRALGPAMVLFLVGLQTIPRETVEAALLDGANAWQVFRRVKLPQIKAVSVVVITMSVVNSFTTFDYVFVMTQGGPYQSSETLAVSIYRLAFGEWNVGLASALAVALSVITLCFSVVYIWRGMQRNPRDVR